MTVEQILSNLSSIISSIAQVVGVNSSTPDLGDGGEVAVLVTSPP